MDKTTSTNENKARAFTFGESEVVGKRNQIFDNEECYWNGHYWETRIEQGMLADLVEQTPYHGSAIDAKCNILLGTLKTSKLLNYQTVEKIIKDYELFGNAYIYFERNRRDEIIAIHHLPALRTRRGKKPTEFYYLKDQAMSSYLGDTISPKHLLHFKKDVLHLKRYDPKQSIYGVPSYLGIIDSAWLSKESILLRRRFYSNGAHMGFVFVLTSADTPDDDIDAIEESMMQSKGVGNFKNMFLHLPGEKPDSVKIMPVGDIATKDDYWNIRLSSRADVLSQHRVPLQLMSIMPESTGSLGKPQDAALVFATNEVKPMHLTLEQINLFAQTTVIEFQDYALSEN